MRRARFFLPISFTLLLLVGSMVPGKDSSPPATSGGMTVGEFALKVVRTAVDDPAVRDSMTAEEALDRLAKAGLHFKGSATDPLTEKEKSSFFFSMANGLLEKLAPPIPGGFEACAEKRSVPECHACCLSLPGASNSSCGKACGRIHGEQKASPSEPTP